MKRTPLRRRRLYRPPPRPEDDKVTPEVAMIVLRRDGGCVAVKLGESPANCWGRLTFDHIKDEPRMADRAESNPAHLVSLCQGHMEDGRKAGYQWNTAHRPELRDYLARFE